MKEFGKEGNDVGSGEGDRNEIEIVATCYEFR